MTSVLNDLRARILVVEDDAIVAGDIAQTLVEHGYAVVATVPDAEQAIEVAGHSSPDLALMDINLPGPRNGVDAGVALRQAHDIPVVYLTAYSDPSTLSRAKESGPFGYVVKPFSANTLLAAIEVAMHRHRLEALLRESEERFQATLRSMTDAVVVTDRSGRVTFVNPAAELLLARPGTRLAGEPVHDVVDFVNQAEEAITNPLTRALETGAPVYLTGSILLRNSAGRLLPVRGSVSPIGADRGRVLGAVAVLRDVTVEGEFERAVAADEARHRRLAEGELWASFTLDGTSVRQCNRAFAAVLGVEIDDALSLDFASLLATPDEMQRLSARLDAEGTVSAHERDLVRPDGMLARVVMWLWTSAGTPRGRIHGRLVDVTEIERARRHAEQSRKMEAIGRLAGGMAHQFGNLLTVVLGHADLLADELREQVAADDLEQIRRAAMRATELLERLLAAGRRRIYWPESFDAAMAVREQLAVDYRVPGRDVQVALAADPAGGTVFADRALFLEALSALIENAAEASGDGGWIRVRVDRQPSRKGDPTAAAEYVCVTVEDAGSGMDQAVLERAVDPFFSSHPSAVGLGLSSAHGFAVQTGGWLELESRSGGGTRAKLCLPVTSSLPPARRPPGSVEPFG